jgi:hypothetical protein
MTYEPSPFTVHMDRGTLIAPKGAEAPKKTTPSTHRKPQ